MNTYRFEVKRIVCEHFSVDRASVTDEDRNGLQVLLLERDKYRTELDERKRTNAI